MIITKITGGLGNQMFQYAAGRAIALGESRELKLDISSYPDHKYQRHYSLDVFNIKASLATSQEIKKLTPAENFLTQKSPRLTRLLSSFTKTYVNEEFRKGLIPKGVGSLYLDGRWQNEKYFVDFAPQIQMDFRLKVPLSKIAETYLKKIKSTNSIGIHIRRGDYVRNDRVKKAVGICGVGYYQKAVRFVSKRVNKPVFFVFSEADGIKWAKKKLKIVYPCVFIDGKDYEDIGLMSSCKHNIIANSSFSWWGAWLNTNPQKIVIVPAPWFENPVSDSHPIVPVGWIEMSKN